VLSKIAVDAAARRTGAAGTATQQGELNPANPMNILNYGFEALPVAEKNMAGSL
jgi:hypothetical protein